MKRVSSNLTRGFTIVELLVVIVVIGILTTITIVSFSGITQKAAAASLQSDLSSASKILKMFLVDYGVYPTTIDCGQADSSTNKCVKYSSGNTFTYQADNSGSPSFSLTATNTSTAINYRVFNDSQPTQVALVCPFGFIVVPGSSTYGTSDFCVMKYEARQSTSTVPISRSSGLPWAGITQPNASSYSANVAGCTGCHLITEAEWLTIAQNVLNVASNWSGGSVGGGYIYSGHNDNSPANAISADIDDFNGYINTGNTSGNQKRTLILSNGEVIWDFAGNVYEWTPATIAGGQQPGLLGESAYSSKQWNNGSLLQNGLPNMAMPGYTGISGASGWSTTQGIGSIYCNYGETIIKYYRRGGFYGDGAGAGVFRLSLSGDAGSTSTIHGFRVAK